MLIKLYYTDFFQKKFRKSLCLQSTIRFQFLMLIQNNKNLKLQNALFMLYDFEYRD